MWTRFALWCVYWQTCEYAKEDEMSPRSYEFSYNAFYGLKRAVQWEQYPLHANTFNLLLPVFSEWLRKEMHDEARVFFPPMQMDHLAHELALAREFFVPGAVCGVAAFYRSQREINVVYFDAASYVVIDIDDPYIAKGESFTGNDKHHAYRTLIKKFDRLLTKLNNDTPIGRKDDPVIEFVTLRTGSKSRKERLIRQAFVAWNLMWKGRLAIDSMPLAIKNLNTTAQLQFQYELVCSAFEKGVVKFSRVEEDNESVRNFRYEYTEHCSNFMHKFGTFDELRKNDVYNGTRWPIWKMA